MDFGAYDMKDKAALVASLPFAYAPIAWLSRLGYFYIEHTYIYSKAWRTLETNLPLPNRQVLHLQLVHLYLLHRPAHGLHLPERRQVRAREEYDVRLER